MPDDPNRTQLERVASCLGQDLLDRLCLVGGCAAGLLISDPASAPVRETFDVDVVADVPTYAAHQQLARVLEDLGFVPAPLEDDPTCRLRKGDLVLDLMPAMENRFQPTNRWYASAMAHRWTTELGQGLRVHTIDAPHFLATKLEAYFGRGQDDPLMSHDLEDVVRVIEGRQEVVDEMRSAPGDVRAAVASGLTRVLQDPHFREALPGYFESGWARSEVLERRLEALQLPGGP